MSEHSTDRGENRPRILFVCGRNRLRSPTAERLYRKDPRIDVRSAGISAKATHEVSASDIDWADLILAMEDEYVSAIRRRFRSTRLPPIRSLDIPDNYDFMADELIELLRLSVEPEIERLLG